jgi:tetratricopeptide (TPR) repeat protein
MHYQYEPLNDEYEFEDFLKDLFNNICNTNSFETYRSKGYSQFGVDVYSPDLKIAIQAKKKSNLRNEPLLIQELTDDISLTLQKLKQFPHRVEQIFIATTTKKYATVQDEAIKQSSKELGVQFWSWEDIQKHIPTYLSLRTKYYPHLSTEIIPKELVITPHLDQKTIIGRETEINALKGLLLFHPIICIHGIGGLGKSTLAKSFYQSSATNYDHILWLDYTGDLKQDISFNECLNRNLRTNLSQEDSPEQRYQAVLSSIIALTGKILIVIDNLQHEILLSVESEIRKLLGNAGMHILLTSRENFSVFNSFNLSSLESKNAGELFVQHCTKQIDISGLDDLLALIDYNPLMIELVAKTMNTGVGLTIPEMIRHISESTLDDKELEIDIDVASGNLYKQVAALVDTEQLNTDSILYIALTMSLLPSVYLPIDDLFKFFLYNEKSRAPIINAITDLYKRGLINRIGDEIKMHRLIQDAIRTQFSTFAVYLGVMNSIVRSLDKSNSTYSANGYQLQQYAESFLAKLKGEKAESIRQPIMMLKNNLFLLYRYLGEKNKAQKMAEELMDDLASAEGLVLSDNVFVSTLHHNFATYYMDEGNAKEAENHLKKAIEISGDVFNLKIVHCYNALFIIYWNQRRVKESFECCVKAMNICQRPEAEGNDHILAMIVNNLAIIYQDMGEINKASGHITMAIKLHRESTSNEKNDGALARYYAGAADIFSLLGNHEVAIQFALHAIKYRSNLNLEKDFELLFFYERAAEVYEKAGDKEKAVQLRGIVRAAKLSFIES